MSQTLLHFLCRSGQQEHVEVFKLLLKFKASVQVADDNGRTPLHEACRRRQPESPKRQGQEGTKPLEAALPPCFGMVDAIAKIDKGLFLMKDAHGMTPLSYVAEEHWNLWINYLDARQERFWPLFQGDSTEPNDPGTTTLSPKRIPPQIKIPVLGALAPNKRPLYSPPQSLTCRQAVKLVSGHIKPDELDILAGKEPIMSRTSSNRSMKQKQPMSLSAHLERTGSKRSLAGTSGDSFIDCWMKPDSTGHHHKDDHYADSIMLGGVPVPTLRYALVTEDYSYNSGAESATRRGSGTSSTFQAYRRGSETSCTSSIPSVQHQQQQPQQQQQLGGEATSKPRTTTMGLGQMLRRPLPAPSHSLPFASPSYYDTASISSGEATSESGTVPHSPKSFTKSLLDPSTMDTDRGGEFGKPLEDDGDLMDGHGDKEYLHQQAPFISSSYNTRKSTASKVLPTVKDIGGGGGDDEDSSDNRLGGPTVNDVPQDRSKDTQKRSQPSMRAATKSATMAEQDDDEDGYADNDDDEEEDEDDDDDDSDEHEYDDDDDDDKEASVDAPRGGDLDDSARSFMWFL